MGWGVVIILAFSALLALIIYLYQEHVDYLNKKIRDLQFEVDLTTECLDAHKEMVEDLEGYYEKWRETTTELNKTNVRVWELMKEQDILITENEVLKEQLKDYNDWVNHKIEKYTV